MIARVALGASYGLLVVLAATVALAVHIGDWGVMTFALLCVGPLNLVNIFIAQDIIKQEVAKRQKDTNESLKKVG